MNGNENFTFRAVRGVILEEQTVVKTHVHGDIRSYGRGNTSGSIGSSNREEQQFWLQKDDGEELHVDLKSFYGTIPLRKGHHVILAYFENRKLPSGLYIENTKISYKIPHYHERSKIQPLQLLLGILIPGILAIIHEITLATIIFVLFFGYILFKKSFKTKENKQREADIASEAASYSKHYAETLSAQMPQQGDSEKLE